MVHLVGGDDVSRGELSTAIREAGTLCVPVTGMREDIRLESFALVLDLPLVSSY